MAADALKWALAAFFLRENVKVLEIKERKDGNTYTFAGKRAIRGQNVRRLIFEGKKQVKVWRFMQIVVILQPNLDKKKVKVRII